ncbi:DHH family phosphoesterase [Candidatus Woesearchaeota archaeon]|nr:MAG: manganese-dependent inorganic pyrophosphatase [archaeon GW2011_AR18]MBS3162118.1 DHH family phosphoesterase [Candidatus Woesearchaeota archaeon]
MIKTLVTSYNNPDLDGSACSFAYAEFLNKTNTEIIAAVFGKIHREAEFVFNKFNITQMQDADDLRNLENYNFILVDSSDLKGISRKIIPNKVIEVIDHRKINDSYMFQNAKVQIELVGSCGTLIAEKFYNNKVDISKESAILLYSAIISNTINFKANVTTDRDRNMASFLKSKLDLPDDYAHEMFYFKSRFNTSLKETIIHDFAYFNFSDKNIGIAQLEIVDVDNFIKNNLGELNTILNNLKNDRKFDFIFLSCIDIEAGFNTFLVIDDSSKSLVENSLNIKFNNNICKISGIIMRKEITPKLKEFLER